jgi:probable F420-dependent oxidoreductase
LEYGAHLPLIDFGGGRFALGRLKEYTATARSLGYTWLLANDHMVFSRPWLDGPTALAAVLDEAEGMTLATSVALPAVRGPVPFAKTAAALDLLSGGRLVVGVGPGSSERDYRATGVPFDERWKRLDESIGVLRAAWSDDGAPFSGRFYSTEGFSLDPKPAQPGGPPIWIGSWGSDAGLRRVSRLGDGWLASSYNTTPEIFAEARQKLARLLEAEGRPAEKFPNGLATAWTYVSDAPGEAGGVLETVVAPMVNRPPEALQDRVLIGTREQCRERLRAYSDAGVERLFVWPVADELRQLEAVADLASGL